MSNLYKQRYVVTDENGARIINSNALVAEKLDELARKTQSLEQGIPDKDGFVAGLNIEAVEVIPKEEALSMEEVLEQKSAEAEKILEKANEQAKETVETANQQADAIRQQAQEDGYNQGLVKKSLSDDTAELFIYFLINFYYSIADLQYCVSLCCAAQ